MKRGRNLFYFIVSCLVMLLAMVLMVSLFIKQPWKKPVDPHAGQVYLYDGKDWTWITPLEGVPVNTLTADKFASMGRVRYLGSEYNALRGVDVSEHQMGIDWKLVADSGVDFACIRLGRRGYTEGGLFEDPWFQKNIRGAAENGLKTGVYFFSQAINVAEAIEEAQFVLDRISGYKIEAPVVYDWEKVPDEGARTAELSMQTRTDCAVAFCEIVRRAGYTPCVYFNRDLGYYGYDLSRLTDYMFWFSLPESPFPNFYYACDIWQYSFTSEVPGIDGSADMSFWFVPRPVENSAAPDEGKT
jgi:Lyzozyme M1 (1,4-beta-N-acetylmuramidase)